MTSILVTYSTHTGTTERFADAIAEGARSVDGVDVTVLAASDATVEDFLAADGVIMGTPVHMGSMDWQTKRLIDEVCSGLWIPDTGIGKVGAVFAVGSGIGMVGAGAELALLSLLANLAELGMVIVPLPKNTPGYFTNGLHWGPVAITGEKDGRPVGIPEEQFVVARAHGANVARVATALAGKDPLTR